MVPIFKPYMPQEIDSEIMTILNSGQLSYGKYGREFESSLVNFIENNKIITTATYNQALLMVLSILDLKPGDEIIASPVSCLASNQPFAVKGLIIKWIDVDPLTSAMDVSQLKRLITPNTKAIFNNIFCGFAGELKDVYEIGKEYGLPVIDDCIEGFGTKYNEKYIGNTGADLTVYSFQTVRLPNTIDGGAISFRSEKLYEKAKLIRDYGIDRSNFRLSNGEINPECDIYLEGYGATMSELNSYIGLKQMEVINDLFEIQTKNAKNWDEFCSNKSDVNSLKIHKDCKPNYWIYGVLAENKLDFIAEMKQAGYYATGVHVNNNIYSIFKNKIDLSGVNEFMKKFVAIPSGWWVDTAKDV
ncbi:UDP-4-amino-4-deoxy-L-arabinose--oxoglutarate aminotransferase [Chryseobacterium aquaeductus]|uniref:UDP-4-amino-4-deoxy-L-arabinose--oxoglutarate aminotransferase n=1 Tax=Chryseobacterium aquaeductus TaxID=2675056 RepID=A0A9N8MPM2_9FLAO|nr:DegT/DnrJ/EryC1/StrS family aminotransferase [Chryseobacterium aquaeductus]CAA7331598.1 UDP-4-amino-4-deoxy-L-arabinose--oxoglutarate aminotransferase [Chryseobacterium potabilaquae]CAD7811164.1 UDP-4-amino-4-deoxy-L-arabinose--oxoglutarate aminotransferase [Chryseobacterium aquaeductus]